MSISSTLERVHFTVKHNKWHRYTAIFFRVGLAWGFLPSGFTKINGERFTSLSNNHPMGQYLEALHHTGYYYTFIGILQVTAAILLLIPRTALLGALLYLPIILNICILSYAVRFEGSALTSPLMVLANLYLLWWNYDKLKYILPINHSTTISTTPKPQTLSNKFPAAFFAAVVASVVIIVLIQINPNYITPRNHIGDCKLQFEGTNRTRAGLYFCDCIHNQGQQLDSCLDKYDKAPDDNIKTP
ncbi:MAG TPA: DoxX family protein [Segetibacter sp.]|jgi:uncharacterized membrane protein YphA (DoxX/SURF4 family)